jgi:hypothetical protein
MKVGTQPNIRASISLPAETFAAVSLLAEQRGVSRNAIIREAIRLYFARLNRASIIEQINAALADETDEERAEQDRWIRASAARTAARYRDDDWSQASVTDDDVTRRLNAAYRAQPLTAEDKAWIEDSLERQLRRLREEDGGWPDLAAAHSHGPEEA